MRRKLSQSVVRVGIMISPLVLLVSYSIAVPPPPDCDCTTPASKKCVADTPCPPGIDPFLSKCSDFFEQKGQTGNWGCDKSGNVGTKCGDGSDLDFCTLNWHCKDGSDSAHCVEGLPVMVSGKQTGSKTYLKTLVTCTRIASCPP